MFVPSLQFNFIQTVSYNQDCPLNKQLHVTKKCIFLMFEMIQITIYSAYSMFLKKIN